MRILVDINHPAHVHLFKNMIWNLKADGHEVKITATDKDIALHLLDIYGFEYEILGKHHKKALNKIYGLIENDYKLYKVAKEFKPDILVSHGSSKTAHVSKLIGKPHISLEDTEHSTGQIRLYAPFTDAILTSTYFKLDFGEKQIRYNGYHELAYLHTNYFTPDPSVLRELGLKIDDNFIILRFVAWEASHDWGHCGIRFETRRQYINELKKYGQILITSENKLPDEFEPYRIKVAPEKFHSLLSYARLCIAESCTVSEEAAMLGIPSIHISTLAKFIGEFDDLQNNYDLVYVFDDDKEGLTKALELLEDKNLKEKWHKKREKLLNEKIDVTKFLTDFIERYPESFLEYKRSKTN